MSLRALLPLAPLLLLAGFWAVASGVMSRESFGLQNRLVVKSTAAARVQTAAPETDAKCTLVAQKLQAAIGEIGNVVIASPFVIGGNLPKAELNRWRDNVVLPAAGALSTSYFPKLIEEPIVVLLLADKEAYRAACRQSLSADAPLCDGFFDADEGMIVIDVETGEGTLVHEMTHAMVHHQMRHAPQWFNEGLASLHESVQIIDGASGPTLRPIDNWRLPILQRAIHEKRVPQLRFLVEGDDFMSGDLAVNYALARSFVHFLHDQGVLPFVVEQIRNGEVSDPLGGLAVQSAFPNLSWSQIEAKFHEWVERR